MSFDLKLHAYRLLIEEPFFAALSRKIEKKESYAIPTAGVRVNPESGHFSLQISSWTKASACSNYWRR